MTNRILLRLIVVVALIGIVVWMVIDAGGGSSPAGAGGGRTGIRGDVAEDSREPVRIHRDLPRQRTDGGGAETPESDCASLRVRLTGECAVGKAVRVRLLHEESGREEKKLLRDSITLSGLEPGVYRMEASGKGWETVEEVFTLEASEEPRERTIEPVPRTRFSGIIVDAYSGAPVPQFTVQPETRMRSTGGPIYNQSFRPYGFDSPDGSFCIAGLSDHDEAVRFDFAATGFESRQSEWFSFEEARYRDGLVIELVRPEDRYGFVEGRVASREEPDGVAGATLILFRAEGDELRESDAWATSGSDGRFRIGDEPFERVRLEARHQEYRTWSSDPFEVPAIGRSVRIDLVLEKGGEIRGRVALHGDAAERLRPQMIELASSTQPSYHEIDADLRFRVAGLDDGVYRVQVFGFNDTVSSEQMATLAGREVVIDNASRETVLFHLGGEPKGPVVEGFVRMPDGDVFATRAIALVAGDHAVKSAAVAVDGYFLLDAVPDGEFVAVVIARSEDDSRLVYTRHPVAVEGGASPPLVEIDATRRRIDGLVEIGGAPVADVALEVRSGPDSESGSLFRMKTGDAGEFILYGLPTGKYTVAAPSRIDTPLPFEVTEGTTADRRLTLRD